jgi:alkylation response protein AidB-like acyl-CoA dehydrogenase
METVEEFRARVRAFVEANLHPEDPKSVVGLLRNRFTDEEELAEVARDRAIQRALWDAGLAGVCFPKEYGGLGLTRGHQQVLNEELSGYEFPVRFQSPTMNPCAAVLLDFGTEEQKLTHIPAILRGEELWMQLLSEPSGGSDVAGALTTAVRDGDEWVLNGSKVWTTGAWWSDWGLCLARTNWDVPKHRGLTVFILPLTMKGVEVHRIEMLNGFKDFCQEFLADVRIPDAWRVGEVDDGWTVGTRWMTHERMLYNSPYVTIPMGSTQGGTVASTTVDIARDAGRLDDPHARGLIGEALMLEMVESALERRVGKGIMTGVTSDQSAAVGRLFHGQVATRMTSITHELSGAAGAAWEDADGYTAETGDDFLMRQVTTIGGGTTEMARNVISERVLGMPRERTFDKDTPYRDVPKGPSNK